MAKRFTHESEIPSAGMGERGNISRIILVVLLLVTAVFGYLYFFTGLIAPRENVATAPLPNPAPVIKPLPPRPTQGIEGTSPQNKPVVNLPSLEGDEKLPPAATDVKPAPPPPQPAPSPAPPAKSVTAPPAKIAAASPSQPTPKPPAVETPAAKPHPAKKPEATVKPAAKTVAKTHTVPAPPSGKTKQNKLAKPVAAAGGKEKKGAGTVDSENKKAVHGGFTLLIGTFPTDREAAKARHKLEKLGMTRIAAKKYKKSETMHRLFLSEYETHEAADAELQKLRPHVSSAFILRENGRYALYAGSYLHEKGAVSERKRLAVKGIKLTLQTAQATLPMNELTAGYFPDRERAEKEMARLRKNGIQATIVKEGSRM